MANRCLNGCIPLSAEGRKLLERAADRAVSMPEYLWERQGEMPVIKWDDRFEKWLDRRIDLARRYAEHGFCLHPWEIYRSVPATVRRADIFAWDQGPLPSCSMQGVRLPVRLLTAIALGAPSLQAFNPVYPFYGAGGTSTGTRPVDRRRLGELKDFCPSRWPGATIYVRRNRRSSRPGNPMAGRSF